MTVIYLPCDAVRHRVNHARRAKPACNCDYAWGGGSGWSSSIGRPDYGHPYHALATPEPATWAMLLVGLAVVAMRKRMVA